MAFGTVSAGNAGEFKTKGARFAPGFGLVLDLAVELPRSYDGRTTNGPDLLGFPMTGRVAAVLGARADAQAPAVGDTVSVLVRPGDARASIFADVERTKETVRFLLEGVSANADGLVARWVHGAGANRSIEELEIVGPPHVSFENPTPADGPRNGYLRLNLDGAATTFDERRSDGVFVPREFTYEQVLARFKLAVEQDLKFRVSQRVLIPSASALVNDQAGLEAVLTGFREAGFTSCVVRSFIAGTSDASLVDVQILSWPADVAPNGDFEGLTYPIPMLQETKRFVELRDGAAAACMEVIPGYVLSLIGNKDTEKSTKHKFAKDVIKGHSDKQKVMYGAQSYGAGISISAVSEAGVVNGLTRLAIRTDGPQYRNLMLIPTPHFADADKIEVSKKAADRAAESGAST